MQFEDTCVKAQRYLGSFSQGSQNKGELLDKAVGVE